MKKRSLLFIIVLLLTLSSSVWAEGYQERDARIYLIEKEFIFYHFNVSNITQLTIEGTFFNDYPYPYGKIYDARISSPQFFIKKDEHQNISFYTPEGVSDFQTNKYKMSFKTRAAFLKYDIDPKKISDDPYPQEVAQYLKPSDKIESDHEEIIATAKSIVGKEQNPYHKAKKIYDYVYLNMDYNLNKGNNSALTALHTKIGVCEDYSRLMVALLRAEGIPARTVGGYLLDPKSTGTNMNINPYRHMWVEFYLNGYGWIPADPTIVFRGEKQITDQGFAQLQDNYYIPESIDIQPSYAYTYRSTKEININPMMLERASYLSDEQYIDEQPDVKLVVGSKHASIGALQTQLDAAPFIANGRTLVPLRFVAENFDAKLTWDPTTEQVTLEKGDTQILLKIKSQTAYVNDQAITLDVAPEIQNNRTLVPLRFIMENFNLNVAWDQPTKTITISENQNQVTMK